MDKYNFILYSVLIIMDIIHVLLNSPLFRFLIQKLIDSFKDED